MKREKPGKIPQKKKKMQAGMTLKAFQVSLRKKEKK